MSTVLWGRVPAGPMQKQLCSDILSASSVPSHFLGSDFVSEIHQSFVGIWIKGYPVDSFYLCALPPQL